MSTVTTTVRIGNGLRQQLELRCYRQYPHNSLPHDSLTLSIVDVNLDKTIVQHGLTANEAYELVRALKGLGVA